VFNFMLFAQQRYSVAGKRAAIERRIAFALLMLVCVAEPARAMRVLRSWQHVAAQAIFFLRRGSMAPCMAAVAAIEKRARA